MTTNSALSSSMYSIIISCMYITITHLIGEKCLQIDTIVASTQLHGPLVL